MADYRANNRNTKAVDLARVRAAANYKVPMYPDLPAALQRRKELLAVQAGLTTNEMGVRYLDEQTSAGKKLDAAVNAMPTSALLEGLGGAFNLVTNKFNPENRKYPDKQVPLKIFGYDVSGGKQTVTQPHQSPNMWTALGAIPGVIGRSVMAPERTDQQNKLWEQARGNPREYMRLLKGLNPAQQAQNSIDTKIKSDEKDYNDMVSMLKDTGISEEELYRGVVVGPDGQINLNANTQAAIDGLGYAGSSLRLTELIGYGLGKPVGMAARAATKAAIPRAVGLATNPRLITAGQATLETLQRGGRPSEAVLGGVAALVAGNKPVSAVGGGVPILREGGSRSRLLPSGEKEAVDRVIAAREAENFIKNKPTPEASSPSYFGGIETRNLSPEAVDERVSGAAEYISPEELADELSTLEGMGFATDDKTPASAKSAVSLTQKELADRTAAALAGIKKRENAVNIKRESKGQDPFKYETHFDPYDLTKEELVTLWGSNPIYVYNSAGEIIPELGAHLGHGPGRALANGGSATLGTVRGQRGIANMRYGSDF